MKKFYIGIYRNDSKGVIVYADNMDAALKVAHERVPEACGGGWMLAPDGPYHLTGNFEVLGTFSA